MVSLANMRGRLPSLYRPEPDDRSLLSQLLLAVAAVLDERAERRSAGDAGPLG